VASLSYDLKITGFDSGRLASYAHAEPGLGGDNSLTVTLPEDELIAEFGLVPETLRVAVRVEQDVPADAWLDAAEAGAAAQVSRG
jgi:hypothetical protein